MSEGVFEQHGQDAYEVMLTAKHRADLIRGNVADHVQLVTEGLEAGDWRTLGFDTPASWYAAITDYHEIPVEIRRRLITALRAEGYSLRRIGVELAVSKETVARALSRNETTELPERIIGASGKSYPASRPRVVEQVTDEQFEQQLPERVTGTDGKSYPARRPHVVVEPITDEELEQRIRELQERLDEPDPDPGPLDPELAGPFADVAPRAFPAHPADPIRQGRICQAARELLAELGLVPGPDEPGTTALLDDVAYAISKRRRA
jgi:transposase